MGRRRKTKTYRFFIVIVLFIAVFLIYYKRDILKSSDSNVSDNKSSIKEEIKDNKIDEKNINKTVDETKKETSNSNNITNKSSSNETKENKNEVKRKGGNVTIELIGQEEVTISKGSKYVDQGFKATYSDGSDASSEVDVDNAVDTSKTGTYTVSYYAGNSVVIRRVTVE